MCPARGADQGRRRTGSVGPHKKGRVEGGGDEAGRGEYSGVGREGAAATRTATGPLRSFIRAVVITHPPPRRSEGEEPS